MNQKKRGFTLIELLAVIVILAIIALIAVPVIMNIITKANKSAFKDTAYGVISAGELYYAEQLLEPNGMTSDVTITLPDATKKLQIKGEVPTGSILITTEGKVAIAVHNNRYCVTKGLEDKDVTIIEDVANCALPSGNVNTPENDEEGNTPDGEDQGGNTPQTGSLSSLATTSTVVTSVPDCVTNGTTCTQGTSVAIKVNANEVYNFYVLNETNNEITLIMDRNIYAEGNTTEPDVAWITKSAYVTAGGNEADYGTNGNNNKGPRTAVSELKTRTSGWSYIPERTYTYSDDGGGNKYTSFTETMRARMLTSTEATNIKTANNNTMPRWMYINLNSTGDNNTEGYWLSTASDNISYRAHYVNYFGNIAKSSSSVKNDTINGVRPVITLAK